MRVLGKGREKSSLKGDRRELGVGWGPGGGWVLGEGKRMGRRWGEKKGLVPFV